MIVILKLNWMCIILTNFFVQFPKCNMTLLKLVMRWSWLKLSFRGFFHFPLNHFLYSCIHLFIYKSWFSFLLFLSKITLIVIRCVIIIIILKILSFLHLNTRRIQVWIKLSRVLIISSNRYFFWFSNNSDVRHVSLRIITFQNCA